jgi:hypothetical protein
MWQLSVIQNEIIRDDRNNGRSRHQFTIKTAGTPVSHVFLSPEPDANILQIASDTNAERFHYLMNDIDVLCIFTHHWNFQ